MSGGAVLGIQCGAVFYGAPEGAGINIARGEGEAECEARPSAGDAPHDGCIRRHMT